METTYVATARRFRPQKFSDVLEQGAIVKTLQNAMRSKKVGHAYLLSGPRGTGKTTLARLIAKALNCENLGDDFEPCNKCRSCKEIASFSSLDVLEIDGASHRGIDDVRKITEGVGYSVSSGHCKVYIIDEVHMLTKEAFNALLKTLEEPPAGAKFILATTELHKVPPTILSRCQRFFLQRISAKTIVDKLKAIAKELEVAITDGALQQIAEMAEGSLRDAESLFDQVAAFQKEKIDEQVLQHVFGLISKKTLFEIDEAGKAGNLAAAFEIIDMLYREGKHLLHFLEMLIDHFRVLAKLHTGVKTEELFWNTQDRIDYENSKKHYTKPQVLDLLAYLIDAHDNFRHSNHPQIALEAILLHILRSHHRVPIEAIVDRIMALENPKQALNEAPPPPPKKVEPVSKQPELKKEPAKIVAPLKDITIDPTPKEEELPNAPSVTLDPKQETLIQFAGVVLEGTIKKGKK